MWWFIDLRSGNLHCRNAAGNAITLGYERFVVANTSPRRRSKASAKKLSRIAGRELACARHLGRPRPSLFMRRRAVLAISLPQLLVASFRACGVAPCE